MTNSPRFVCVFAALAMAAPALAQVVSWEGFSFPDVEDETWEPTPYCDPGNWIDDGWMYAQVDFDCGAPPHGGSKVRYIRTLPEFVGEERLFFEWRVETDGDSSEIPGMSPTTMVMEGTSPAGYNFIISRDLVTFFRDVYLDYQIIDIAPEVPHTYRLELYGTRDYRIYIDGEFIFAGVPDYSFPGHGGDFVVFRAYPWYLPNTTKWDYVRLGTIPIDGSGDFDSDFDVDADDYYFFMQYFSGKEIDAGPGGRFADFDGDADVDCEDWLVFAKLASRLEGEPPGPGPAECRPSAESLSKAVDDRPPFSAFHRP